MDSFGKGEGLIRTLYKVDLLDAAWLDPMMKNRLSQTRANHSLFQIGYLALPNEF